MMPLSNEERAAIDAAFAEAAHVPPGTPVTVSSNTLLAIQQEVLVPTADDTVIRVGVLFGFVVGLIVAWGGVALKCWYSN